MDVLEIVKKIDVKKIWCSVKEQKKKWVPICIVVIGLAVLGIGILAKKDPVSKEDPQVITKGELKIELEDSQWEARKTLKDKEEVDFRPTVINEGTKEAYIFVQLDMPSAYVVTITPEEEQVTETALFRWKVLDGWTQLGQIEKNESNTVHTYTYVYGTEQEMTALKKGEEATLFDGMLFANIIGGVDPKKEELQTSVHLYAIDQEALDQLSWEQGTSSSDIWEALKEQREIENENQ